MQIIYNLVKLNLNPQFPIMSSSSPILACSKVITTHTFESKHPTSVYSPHRGLINCATFNHTNKVIASCGQDGKIVLVSSQQKQKILAEFHFDGRKQTYGLQDPKYTNVPNVTSPTSVNCCLFSPHSRYIAAGSADNYVKVWQMKNHKDIFLTLKHHNDQISSLAWTKNQQILASSSKAGTIAMHSMKSKSLIQQITLKSQDPINAIRFSEGIDYHRFAACTQSGSIKIWDIQSNRGAVKISDFDNINKVSVTSISFSTFNPVLLVASSIDQNLTFYDISQKKAVKTIATEQPLTAVNFYSDGHTLIAGGMYGGLFIYDLRKPQKPKQKLSGHQTAVKYIDFHKQKQSQYHQPKQSIKSQQNVNSRISRTSGTNSVTKLGNKQVQKRQNEKQPNQENSLQFKREGTSSTRPQTTVIQPRQKQITTTSNIQNSASKTINPVPPIAYNRRTQLGSVPPVSNTTQPNPPLQNNFIPIQKPIKVQRGGGSIKIQGQMQQAFQDLRIKLEDSMSQKMGLIHVQIIRQFQIQQQQIKSMLERTFQQSKQKDRRIKQLEEQIFNMKKSRY